MATTTMSNVIIPEVLAEMIAAQIPGKLAIAGTSLVSVRDDLQSSSGSAVKIPKWGAIGAFDLLSEGVAMTPVNLTSSSATATVEDWGKAVEISEQALLASYADPMAELAGQFARYAAQAVDKKLITVAETTSQSHSVAATISLDAVLDALAKFSDEREGVELILHPKQATDLMKLSEFKTLTQFADGVLTRGAIGALYGMPVHISRFITQTAGAPDTYTGLLVKPGALGLWYQKRPEVKTDQDILARTTVVAVNSLFAAALYATDPVGATKLVTQ